MQVAPCVVARRSMFPCKYCIQQIARCERCKERINKYWNGTRTDFRIERLSSRAAVVVALIEHIASCIMLDTKHPSSRDARRIRATCPNNSLSHPHSLFPFYFPFFSTSRPALSNNIHRHNGATCGSRTLPPSSPSSHYLA